MRSFPLTQIAVNLLLIVFLAMQPVAICLAQGVSRAGYAESSGANGVGCGCCRMSLVDSRCCCCRMPAKAETTDHADTCCGEHGQPLSRHTAERPEKALQMLDVAGLLRSRPICVCGHDSPPVSDSAPRHSSVEQRNLPSAANPFESVVAQPPIQRKPEQSRVDLGPPHRYWQVVLCIWRL